MSTKLHVTYIPGPRNGRTEGKSNSEDFILLVVDITGLRQWVRGMPWDSGSNQACLHGLPAGLFGAVKATSLGLPSGLTFWSDLYRR